MQYRIYVDVLFLQEVIINFYTLELCKLIFRSTATHKKIGFTALFASVYQVILLYIPYPSDTVLFYIVLFVFYMCGSFLTICIGFGKKSRKVYIKFNIVYMVMMLILGGIFLGILPRISFFQSFGYKWIVFGTFGVVVYMLLKSVLKEKQSYAYYGSLEIRHGGKSFKGDYFMDSGNGLLESISKKPVLLAEEKWLFQTIKKEEVFCRPVLYKSVGKTKGILYAYCMDELIIYGEKESYKYDKVWIGICREELFKNKEYQVIVPSFYGTHFE